MDTYEKDTLAASDKAESATPNGVTALNARRRAALAEVDNAKFGWVHVKTCLVAGVGFYVSFSSLANARPR